MPNEDVRASIRAAGANPAWKREGASPCLYCGRTTPWRRRSCPPFEAMRASRLKLDLPGSDRVAAEPGRFSATAWAFEPEGSPLPICPPCWGPALQQARARTGLTPSEKQHVLFQAWRKTFPGEDEQQRIRLAAASLLEEAHRRLTP